MLNSHLSHSVFVGARPRISNYREIFIEMCLTSIFPFLRGGMELLIFAAAVRCVLEGGGGMWIGFQSALSWLPTQRSVYMDFRWRGTRQRRPAHDIQFIINESLNCMADILILSDLKWLLLPGLSLSASSVTQVGCFLSTMRSIALKLYLLIQVELFIKKMLVGLNMDSIT